MNEKVSGKNERMEERALVDWVWAESRNGSPDK